MTRIGTYDFPDQTTIVQINEIEAKSKIRKEIHIQSLIESPDPTALREQTDTLQAELESFDKQQATVSLEAGKYYNGRKRNCRIIPRPEESLAWVDLLLLTNDRYERSLALHRYNEDTHAGRAQFSLFNSGNWFAPILVTLIPASDIHSLRIQNENGEFSLDAEITADQTVVIDSETRRISLEGNNLYAATNEEFPILQSGANHVTISIEPMDTVAHCTIEYRDTWV